MESIRPTSFDADGLAVEVHADRTAASRAAARAAAAYLSAVVDRQGAARVMFACAPSQDDFLAALVDPAQCGHAVDWRRITAFHLDEYVGLPAAHPQSFRRYLQEHLVARVPVGNVHLIEADGPDLAAACERYAAPLQAHPLDLVCLGVGENGHIAFNDPPADFDDPVSVRLVDLDTACRQQQVNDGCFADLTRVPTRAITVTIPVVRRARRLSACVFGPRKALAVFTALRGPIAGSCPASVLRTHPAATLFLDPPAAALVR
jgi:glucosamine-6-phosphate deaminase